MVESPTKTSSAGLVLISGAARSVCLVAAGMATSVISAALLIAWHAASPGPWLAPTPGLLAEVAECQALAGRRPREQCRRSVVEARRGRLAPVEHVAQR
jgi:hypothetical protein